jgi:RAQPRD family integrative conjugative element protein
MSTTGNPTIVRRRTLGWVLVSLLAGLQPAFAGDTASEEAQLTILVRQLDMLDRLAEQCERLPQEKVSRYHFDYPRLHADVQRMRAGIRDYLSPPRAQPRDPDALLGDYRAANDKTEAQP